MNSERTNIFRFHFLKRIALSIQLGFRFLRPKKRRARLSFTAKVSVFGVMIGVTALLVVTSVINGFESKLQEIVTGSQGEIILYTRGAALPNGSEFESKVMRDFPVVKKVIGTLVKEVMFTGPKGVQSGVVEGLPLTDSASVLDLENRVLKGGRWIESPGEMILGASIAERLGIEVGSSVRLILPFRELETRDFQVVGLVKMGMHDFDSKFSYASIDDVRSWAFQNPEDQSKEWITTLRMKIRENPETLSALASRMSEFYGHPFRARDWTSLNRNLLYAIKLEKAVISILLTAIMVVAAFNIISALLMLVHEREKEIAILRVIGHRRFDQFFLFTFLGSWFGFMGSLLGFFVSLIAVALINGLKWIRLPPEVYHLEYLPASIEMTEWSLILMVAFMICLVATVGPAIRISRRTPTEGLRWS